MNISLFENPMSANNAGVTVRALLANHASENENFR